MKKCTHPVLYGGRCIECGEMPGKGADKANKPVNGEIHTGEVEQPATAQETQKKTTRKKKE